MCLSTDDPLQIHLTKEPLVEEYSIAAQVILPHLTDGFVIVDVVVSVSFDTATHSGAFGRLMYLEVVMNSYNS